jgi:hypothetical protein
MKKLYIVYFCDDTLGEAQGMFDAEDNLLGAWSDNDANWRNEYLSPFMEKLGFDVAEREPTRKDRAVMKKHFGL